MGEFDGPRIHEANRRSWNAATAAHNRHKRDQAGHLRRGGTTLFPEELELLGDVSGSRVVHLQCNSGQDTLSLAQLREYPFLNAARLYEDMREAPGRRMVLPEGTPSVPLMFGLVASRPGKR